MVVPVPGSTAAASSEHERVVAELAFCRAMRDIHRHDAVEVEELYRRFVFPGLPRDERRARLLHELIGTTIGEAIYIIQNLHEGLRVPGDVCEFRRGPSATSRLLASEIMSSDRNLWLFDSFEGLPAPGPQDKLINDIFSLGSMDKYKGMMASPEAEVRSKLDSISFPPARTKVKKGWVSDSISRANFRPRWPLPMWISISTNRSRTRSNSWTAACRRVAGSWWMTTVSFPRRAARRGPVRGAGRRPLQIRAALAFCRAFLRLEQLA